MSWRTKLPAGLIALLVAATLVAAVMLSVHYERNEREEALVRATDAAVTGIRQRLRDSEQSLLALAGDLAKAGEDGAVFERTATELLANAPALLRVELRDEAGALRRAVDAPAPRPRLDENRGRLGFETMLALRSALDFERPLYSRTYYVALGSGSGFEVVDLVVPAPIGRPLALVATWSLTRLLDQMLPTMLLQSHQVYLTETDGTFVARSSSGLHGAGVYTAASPLELPGVSLQLRTNSVQGQPKLIPNLIAALLIVVTLALAASAALLWRDWRLRARAERALHAQYAFRKAMEDSLFTGLRARDLEGRITYVNPAFCRMTGYTADEMIGQQPPMPYWTPDRREKPAPPVEQPASHSPDRLGYETEFMRRNGERFPVLIFEAPLIDEQGRHAGWMGSILDQSEQKRVEELNRLQQEKLQANTRMALLGEIASALSHELNQPLAAISSYAAACENLLRNGTPPGSATFQSALARIRGQSERAGQVIRSVQDFVRRRRVDRQQLALGDLLRSVEPLIRLQASKSGGRFEWRADHEAVVLGDRTMLEQVLLNLTRNGFEAMDETPQEQRLLEVDVMRVGKPDRRAVAVEVRDRGKGVAPEHEEQLFTAFFTTKPDGLGVGLSLCRTVIEAHGGNLSHLRRDGGGTIFRFELPVGRLAGPTNEAMNEATHESR